MCLSYLYFGYCTFCGRGKCRAHLMRTIQSISHPGKKIHWLWITYWTSPSFCTFNFLFRFSCSLCSMDHGGRWDARQWTASFGISPSEIYLHIVCEVDQCICLFPLNLHIVNGMALVSQKSLFQFTDAPNKYLNLFYLSSHLPRET